MKRLLTIALIVCFASAGCAAVINTDADEAAVREHGQTWLKHYKAGDIDALMALYEPDAILALHDQPMRRGVDEIRAYFEPGMGQSEIEFELDIEHVEVYGDQAWLVSKYWLRATAKSSGYVYEDAGRSMLIYRRGSDGEWRIAADLDNNTPDVSMETMPGG
ncbi:MAG: SgcJ/EcaC family oxidoreductase [Pseudomonadota bacterium]